MPAEASAQPTVGAVQPAGYPLTEYGSPPAIGYEIASSDWGFHFLPESILYKAYLAGMKESRLAGHVFSGSSGVNGGDLLFEGTLGGRFGVFRIGNGDHLMPQGFQVDIEGYMETRRENLEQLAHSLAEKARRIKKPISMGQMNAYDRRIVHLALQDDPKVSTKSRGEGHLRKIVIFPKRPSKKNG